MQAPSKMIKDGQVVANTWQTLSADDATEQLTSSNIIVPLALWQRESSLQSRSDVGVLISNDTDLESITENLQALPLIAIDFPVFMDGRGFSLGRLLRERYQFAGELRAVGHIIRDQLCYLKRCGFNAFEIADSEVDLDAAVASLNDFSEAYQTSVDIPTPLFRRRA